MKTKTFLIVSRPSLLRMRNVSQKIVEKIKTHILGSITFFCVNRAVFEIMRKNIVEATDDNMAHVHFALDT